MLYVCVLLIPCIICYLGQQSIMLSVWKSCKLLTDNDFQTIQDKIDAFIVPDDVGRIPSKIALGFAGFTVNNGRIGFFCIHFLH